MAYDAPFTRIDASGIDGVFSDTNQLAVILEIVRAFDPGEAFPLN